LCARPLTFLTRPPAWSAAPPARGSRRCQAGRLRLPRANALTWAYAIRERRHLASWIPSEAVTGGTRAAFDAGVTRYDEPPPDELSDVETLRAEDRFRFANVLKAFMDVDDVVAAVDAGQLERSAMEELSGSHRREEATPAQPQ
jgi:hypothetical protein